MVHARKSQPHPTEKSRQLQRRLYLAAKRHGQRCFHALYDRIFRSDILWRAWQEVRANGGAAGVDGVSIEEVECQGVEPFLQALAADLKAKRYRPQPVLRVHIPKPDGRQRPLGIPTVRDRVVQQACRIVVEPLFEADFLPCSFGFRPQRSAGQAVQQVKKTLVRGWWVVDVDIQGYFDSMDQDRLLELVQRRISDRRVVKLIRQWLKAGVVEDGQWHPTTLGTPQGGVIRPAAGQYLSARIGPVLDPNVFFPGETDSVCRRYGGDLPQQDQGRGRPAYHWTSTGSSSTHPPSDQDSSGGHGAGRFRVSGISISQGPESYNGETRPVYVARSKGDEIGPLSNGPTYRPAWSTDSSDGCSRPA